MDDQGALASSSAVVAPVTEPDRTRAIVRLRDRYAADAVGLDEFSGGLDAVLSATARDELLDASPEAGTPVLASSLAWAGAEVLERHLPPGEEILWVGRPGPGRAPHGWSDRYVFGFSIAWLAFAVFWEATAVAAGAPAFFALFGAIFVVVGCYRLYSLVVPRRRAALYAVTTKRVVRVIEERSGERVDTALLQTIPNISVTPTKRGHGTILFGNRAVARWQSMAGNPWARDQIDETIEFVNIPEPSAVARLVGSLQSHGSV